MQDGGAQATEGYSVHEAAVTNVQIVPGSGKGETRVVPEREEFGIGLGVNRGYASGAARGYISESERFARSGTCTRSGVLADYDACQVAYGYYVIDIRQGHSKSNL